LVLLLGLAVLAGYAVAKLFPGSILTAESEPKQAILKVALVTDSHNDNDLLAKALAQAKAERVDFVIGMGDFTNTGTLDELAVAKNVFDASGLTYYVTAGDHDLWDSRDKAIKAIQDIEDIEVVKAKTALDNFQQVFGQSEQSFGQKGMQFVIVDNSDIYIGIHSSGWIILENALSRKQNDVAQNTGNSKLEIRNSKNSEQTPKLTFVFTHKTPYHPQSAHIMGEQTPVVAEQAKALIKLIEATHPCHSERSEESAQNKILRYAQDDKRSAQDDKRSAQDDKRSAQDDRKCPAVDGFFSGDLHFFANFNSPGGSVKMTTIGAVTREPNPQGPRFGVLTVFDDYTWEVKDVEIR